MFVEQRVKEKMFTAGSAGRLLAGAAASSAKTGVRRSWLHQKDHAPVR